MIKSISAKFKRVLLGEKMQTKELTGYASIDRPWMKYYPEEVLNQEVPECTIFEYIKNDCAGRLDKPAINYFGTRHSYKDMFKSIDDAANSFYKLGVRQGDIVSFCMLTMPETIYGLYACNKIGAVFNSIEPRTNAENIKKRINTANSTVLVVVDVFLKKILSIVDKTQLKKIIVVPITNSMPPQKRVIAKLSNSGKIARLPKKDGRFLYWNDFIESGKDTVCKQCEYKKNMPCAIIYTGGTTGVPKGAILPNETFIVMISQLKYDQPYFFTRERMLEIMPPFIAYGLVCGFFLPFCAGVENYLIPVFKPKKFADLVIKIKPNHVVGVPTFFESLANSKKLKGKRLDYLVSIVTGGDRLLVSTEEHINKVYKEHGCEHSIIKGYGMTEMGSAVTLTACEECNLPGSVGIPCHYNIVKVIDPKTGEELRYGEQGELCMTGRTMMLGYFNNPEETSKVFHRHADGRIWIHTGDLGYITEDGVVFVVDRLKRMIIRPDGHNVWPSQIEAVLAQHPAVSECAVVGIKNNKNKNGHIPTAFIVPKDNSYLGKLENEIDAFCKAQLPERDCAMAYRFVESIPMTLVGKVDYRALEKQGEAMNKRRA